MAIGAGLWLGACSTSTRPAEPDAATTLTVDLAIVGARVYPEPGGPPIDDGFVAIRTGEIVAVGRRLEAGDFDAERVLDATGLTLTAGLWNSHVHLFEERWRDAGVAPARRLEGELETAFTRLGFTTIFDLGSPGANTRALRGRIESGELRGPRILTTAEPLMAPGAMPPPATLEALGLLDFPPLEVLHGAEFDVALDVLFDRGVDGVKLHLGAPRTSQPPIDRAQIARVLRRARAEGRPLFLHPETRDDVARALRLGVDVLAHTTPGAGAWGPEWLADLEPGRTALTPTLTLWRAFPDPESGGSLADSAHASGHGLVARAIEQLEAWRAAGGCVLFGTDAGAVRVDSADEFAAEIAAMARARMDFDALLEALTTAPADHFGQNRGRVVPGAEADLVLFAGDPAEDVQAWSDVVVTIVGGRIVSPLHLSGNRPAAGARD